MPQLVFFSVTVVADLISKRLSPLRQQQRRRPLMILITMDCSMLPPLTFIIRHRGVALAESVAVMRFRSFTVQRLALRVKPRVVSTMSVEPI